jgi:hypothetical protein
LYKVSRILGRSSTARTWKGVRRKFYGKWNLKIELGLEWGELNQNELIVHEVSRSLLHLPSALQKRETDELRLPRLEIRRPLILFGLQSGTKAHGNRSMLSRAVGGNLYELTDVE